MAKIVVTGATGLLGRALMQVLKQQHQVIGTGFSRAKPPIVALDLGDKDKLENFLSECKPDVLIHAAAERRPDKCENAQEDTLKLNVDASKQLAALCAKYNIRLFFISTDYVFDGNTPPYNENAETNPLNFYGESKAAAEKAVLALSAHHTVVRVPVLYGEVEYLDESAVTTIAKSVLGENKSKQDHWAIRFPTHVEDIALTLNDLVNQPHKNCGGIFHITDVQAMTKYDIACVIAESLGRDTSTLVAQPEPDQTAPRPFNCALQDTRLHKLGIDHKRDFNTAITAVLAPHC